MIPQIVVPVFVAVGGFKPFSTSKAFLKIEIQFMNKHSRGQVSCRGSIGRGTRARNYWVPGFPGQPKMVTKTQNIEAGFPTRNQGLSGGWTTLIAREIEILRQAF